MALFFKVNKNPTNHVQSMLYLWQTMVNAGWLVLSWSDGTVMSGSPGPGYLGFMTDSLGEPVATSGQLGAANNSRAWILLAQPTHPSGTMAPYSGSRQFTFQRSTTLTRQWRIKYSHSGGYYPNPSTAGTATATPGVNSGTVNDEVLLRGGGTDASPSFTDVFGSGMTEGAQRLFAMADDGLSGSLTPYGFFVTNIPAGGNASPGDGPYFYMMFDPLAVGSANPNDRDPFVWATNSNTSAGTFQVDTDGEFNTDAQAAGAPATWFRKGETNQSFVGVAGCSYAVSRSGVGIVRVIPHNIGGNVQNSFDDLVPIVYARRSALGGNTGYKGVSSFVRWNGSLRATGETLSVTNPGTTRDRIVVGNCNVPWDGATVPLI